MEPWEAYQYYTALKLHFESDKYDAFKYNFKSSATQRSFLKRRDKYFFAKLAKKYPDPQTMIQFLAANLVANPKVWIGELLDRPAEEVFAAYQKKRDAFTYTFTQEIDTLANWAESKGYRFDDLVASPDQGVWPRALQYHWDNPEAVSLETVAVLDLMVNFMAQQRVTETLIWPELQKKLHKYELFLRHHVDLKKCKQIVLKRFTA